MTISNNPIIEVMSRFVAFAAGEADLILTYFTEKKYKRNDILLHSGQLAQDVFFVETGALHQFYTDDNGIDRTCNFIFENEFITDLESFSKKQPATCFIQALEPSTCRVIKCAALMELMEASPATREFFRIIVEQVASDSIRRTRILQSSSPEKAFMELLAQRPDIFQRVPQRLVAQYLGIAPESLSRIKKRMMVHAKS